MSQNGDLPVLIFLREAGRDIAKKRLRVQRYMAHCNQLDYRRNYCVQSKYSVTVTSALPSRGGALLDKNT